VCFVQRAQTGHAAVFVQHVAVFVQHVADDVACIRDVTVAWYVCSIRSLRSCAMRCLR